MRVDMSKKAVVFPYDDSNISFILHENVIDYKVTHVVSPISWGYCFKDAGHNFGIVTNCEVKDDLEKTISEIDALIILESKLEFSELELFLLSVKFLENRKNIVLLRNMTESYIDLLKKTADYYGVDFLYDWNTKDDSVNISEYTLLNPPVPVVAVLGMATSTGKFESLLAIKKNLTEKGYSVLGISAKAYGEFMNVESYPNYMLTLSLEVQDKILAFNHYINKLYRMNKPDIIIIEIPGGIFPVSNKIHENFAFQNYLISNAIEFDLCILNLNFERITSDYLSWLKDSVEKKYNYDIAGYLVYNYMINWNAASTNTTSYITVSKKFVEDSIADMVHNGTNICCPFNTKEVSNFCDRLIDLLTEEHIYDSI